MKDVVVHFKYIHTYTHVCSEKKKKKAGGSEKKHPQNSNEFPVKKRIVNLVSSLHNTKFFWHITWSRDTRKVDRISILKKG